MSSTLQSLRQEYERMYEAMAPSGPVGGAAKKVAKRLLANKFQYVLASGATGIPWGVIAVIHERKCGGRFDVHLHNNDPLSDRTRTYPAFRPRFGEPPFEWWESASDALRYDEIDDIASRGDWGIAEACYAIEKWSGWGYRTMSIQNAYLWSGSNHYQIGFFGVDGHLDRNAVDRAPGAMVVLARLLELSPDALGQKPPETVSKPSKGRSTMPEESATIARVAALGVALLFGAFAVAGGHLATRTSIKPATAVVLAAAPAAPVAPVIEVVPAPEANVKLPELPPAPEAVPAIVPVVAPVAPSAPEASVATKTPTAVKKRPFPRKLVVKSRPVLVEKPADPVTGDMVRSALGGL